MRIAANLLLIFLIGLLTFLFGAPGTLVGLLLPGKTRKGRLFRFVSKSYSRIVLFLMGAEVAERGRENVDPAKQYIFMSNHISHADSPALTVVIPQPLHWVFKKELARIPVLGWFLLAAGQIMVDRGDLRQARGALSSAVAGLSAPNSVIIYPEGTRSRDGRLQPFKKGGFHMALKSRWPIVPVRVSGTREIVAAGTLSIRPGNVLVELFPPIATEGKSEEDVPDLMARVREAMLSGTPDQGERRPPPPRQ